MGAYGKVELVETENIGQETVVEQNIESSTVNEQVGKFDNSYEVKLQELYKEYDKITLDEEKIKSMTEIKVNASKRTVSFRMGLALTTTMVVTVLLAFLCIYNIFVINGMTGNIDYLQGEVSSSRYELVQAEGLYDSLVDTNNIQSELLDMGYTEVASSNMVTISVPDKTEVVELQADTNWFDAICNFLSRIFG